MELIYLGKVNFGLDWGLVDSNGTWREDTVYFLQTDDGVNIMVRAQGQGANVHHRFEVASNTTYYWLNNVVAYAMGTQVENGVILDVWQVCRSHLVSITLSC